MSIERTLELDEKRTQESWDTWHSCEINGQRGYGVLCDYYNTGGEGKRDSCTIAFLPHSPDNTHIANADFIANAPKAVQQLRDTLTKCERYQKSFAMAKFELQLVHDGIEKMLNEGNDCTLMMGLSVRCKEMVAELDGIMEGK